MCLPPAPPCPAGPQRRTSPGAPDSARPCPPPATVGRRAREAGQRQRATESSRGGWDATGAGSPGPDRLNLSHPRGACGPVGCRKTPSAAGTLGVRWPPSLRYRAHPHRPREGALGVGEVGGSRDGPEKGREGGGPGVISGRPVVGSGPPPPRPGPPSRGPPAGLRSRGLSDPRDLAPCVIIIRDELCMSCINSGEGPHPTLLSPYPPRGLLCRSDSFHQGLVHSALPTPLP